MQITPTSAPSSLDSAPAGPAADRDGEIAVAIGEPDPTEGALPARAQLYRCAGLRISSDLPLSAPAASGPPDAVVTAGEVRDVPWQRPSADVVAERVVDGIPWYTFARRDDDTVARFYGLADFVIDDMGRRLRYHRDPAAHPELLSILIAGSLTAYLLSASGTLVLHASAVEVAGGALAFVGPSGQGKTTVATLLCADGLPLVADDLLAVEPQGDTVCCVPSATELRVRQNAVELVGRFPVGTVRRQTIDERSAVAATVTAADRLPLRTVVIPWPDRESRVVRARRLSAAEAAFALARHQRIEGWTSPVDRRAQFDSVSALAAAVPVLEARIPWGPQFSPELGVQLLAALEQHGPA